jgi:hypothetical protein
LSADLVDGVDAAADAAADVVGAGLDGLQRDAVRSQKKAQLVYCKSDFAAIL